MYRPIVQSKNKEEPLPHCCFCGEPIGKKDEPHLGRYKKGAHYYIGLGHMACFDLQGTL